MGRPTKYNEEETVKLAEEYTDGEFMLVGDVLPTIEGLADYLGVAKSTVELWAQKHEDFSGAFRRMIGMQKKILINQGLIGNFQSTIAKLILSSCHGVNETSNVVAKTTNLNVNAEPTTVEDAANIYRDMVKNR